MGKFEIFKGKRNKNWYWHYRAVNGRIMADSGEGYKTRWGAKRGIKRFVSRVSSAEVVNL